MCGSGAHHRAAQTPPELHSRALQAYAARFSETEFAKQMKPILFETRSGSTLGNLHESHIYDFITSK